MPLVILDVQDAIDQPIWDQKNNPEYIYQIQKLLSHWREKKWPIIFIRHDEPTETSTYHTYGPWNGIKKDVQPAEGETIIPKTENCAFIKTGFNDHLKAIGAEIFILTGVVIHNSIDATARAGKALGYNVILPHDATTAVPVTGLSGRVWSAKDVFDISLGILDGEYVDVTTSEKVMKRFNG